VAAVDELHEIAQRIERLGRRHDDPTLVALGTASQVGCWSAPTTPPSTA
jgi:hypothetical protein